jgi:hypothetical protein
MQMRRCLLVIAGLLLGLVLADPSSAANRKFFTDPPGDNQKVSDTNYASDVRQIEVSTTDEGTMAVSVTLADPVGYMVYGDSIDFLINSDRNAQTGESGYDYKLFAYGRDRGRVDFGFCKLPIDPGPCSPLFFSEADMGVDSSGAKLHRVTWSGLTVGGFNIMDFRLVAYYFAGGPKDEYPNGGGSDRYDLLADPDQDGVFGGEDVCPKQAAAGVFDRNHNGCPGPFRFISAFPRVIGVIKRGAINVRLLRIEGDIPSGAAVVISVSRRVRLRANEGFARTTAIKRLRLGRLFTIQITHPGWVGFSATVKVTRTEGTVVTRRTCLQAVGNAAVSCSAAGLEGA